MKIEKDRALWYEALLDTPIATPRAGLTHDEALHTPGCYVKTHAGSASKGPDMLGRLVSIKDGIAVVCSNEPYHDGHGNPFVWSGSIAEYVSTWRCD